MFDHKCVFRIKYQEGIDIDELQLALCDYDDDPEVFVEEQEDEDENITKNIVIYGAYESYGGIQKFIEDNGYELVPEASKEFLTQNLRMLLQSSARH